MVNILVRTNYQALCKLMPRLYEVLLSPRLANVGQIDYWSGSGQDTSTTQWAGREHLAAGMT